MVSWLELKSNRGLHRHRFLRDLLANHRNLPRDNLAYQKLVQMLVGLDPRFKNPLGIVDAAREPLQLKQ
jgi:hypothetical protein